MKETILEIVEFVAIVLSVFSGMILAVCILMSPIIYVSYKVDQVVCERKWSQSGYPSKYPSILTGCLVQRKDGSWIPSEIMRDLLSKEGQ